MTIQKYKIYISLFILIIIQYPAFPQKESPGDIYNFYQKFISDIRAQKCPMYPSCSKYAMEAFNERGLVNGFLITSDRLTRCGHEHKFYDMELVEGEFKFIDLVTYPDSNSQMFKKSEKEYSKSFDENISDAIKFFLHLIDKELYREAITEYHRLKFEDPRETLTLEYNYFKALMSIEEYEKIIFEYENFKNPSLTNDPNIILKVSEAWFGLNQAEKSIEILDINIDWKDINDRRLAFKGFLYAQLDQFDKVQEQYAMVSENYIFREYLSQNIQTINSITILKQKKPVLAGVLGIIPGAGYMYSGHTTTGISSLVLNGLLGYATYTSFKTENYGIGILTGLFSTAFYIGNISGGYKAAKRYNTSQKENYKKKLMYSFN